ncbi:GNAT family N-acetyltransferase [Candidatus Woesearchaeota archaeon]|nr:GNAT family N-acetyltransferase [Candidatus Woesearchaeota archaeon]
MIRKATKKDIQDIAFIELNSGYKFRGQISTNEEIDRIKDDFLNGCDFFIEKEKRAYVSVLFKNSVCHVDYLSVIKREHGEGLGGLFMQFIEKKAINKKCKKISLEVNSKNSAAINLYKKLGYSVVKVKEKVNYGKKATKFVMEKDLNLSDNN